MTEHTKSHLHVRDITIPSVNNDSVPRIKVSTGLYWTYVRYSGYRKVDRECCKNEHGCDLVPVTTFPR